MEPSHWFKTVILGARGYRKAKELLDEEYGQESDIAADYLEFLKAGEKIDGTDVDALSKVAQDMAKCSVTRKEIDYAADLDAQATLNSIVDRLPNYMKTKWVDKANDCRMQRKKTYCWDASWVHWKQSASTEIKSR